MNEKAAKVIADKMIEFRTEKGLSQARLAKYIGVAQSTVSRLESCDAKTLPDVNTLVIIAKSLGVTFNIRIKTDGTVVIK